MTKHLSLWRVAVRPRWIAALALAFAVAGVFAALGQWQLESSIASATIIDRDTETLVPLSSLETPQSIITTEGSGRRVSAVCSINPRDDLVITNRQSPDREGSWLVRHCVTDEGNSLVVVAGWIPPGFDLGSLAPGTQDVVGRYVPTESAQQSDFRGGKREAVAVAELLNLWSDPGPVYGGYLVLEAAPQGLETISTLVPATQRELNVLNLFYAVQWAVFGVFALYLWFRLVKDAWEGELEEASGDAPKLV